MRKKLPLIIVLVIAFINYVGIGLVFPVFSPLLLSAKASFLHAETSPEIRGMWLGILIALMPLGQFFSSPVWGAMSDSRGRKYPLIFSLSLAVVGYLFSAWSIAIESLWGLATSRLLIGIAAGNVSILQATIADISTDKEKAKRYSLFSMAMGAGFTFGPMIGGCFSGKGYEYPFLLTAALILMTLVIILRYFVDTVLLRQLAKVCWFLGFTQLKRAFTFKGLRTIFACSFLGVFGWCYFFELIPVFLIQKFDFSPYDLGIFCGLSGAFYALSTGLLIRPLLNRFKPVPLFLSSAFLTGLVIMAMVFSPSSFWLWPAIFLICYLTAPFSPISTTLVSNGVPPKIQGEALGILGSVWAAAYVTAPLISGTFIGKCPESALWIGGGTMCFAGIIGALSFYSKHKRIR